MIFKFFSIIDFFKIIFNLRVIALQYCVGFCHTSTWISHKYTYFPSFLNFPPPPTPSHLSRLSQSPGLSSLSHRAISIWRSIVHMIVYIFTCYSVFPTLSFPNPCPQVCSLCLHLHCYPANRFISTLSRFYICVLIYICFSLFSLLHSV